MMGDPAGHKEIGSGERQVQWIKPDIGEEVPDMIKRHDDHRDATQEIDGVQTDFCRERCDVDLCSADRGLRVRHDGLME
jgi:hypothetical protein